MGHTIILLGPSWCQAVGLCHHVPCQTTLRVILLDITLKQLMRFLVNCGYEEIIRNPSATILAENTVDLIPLKVPPHPAKFE